MELATKADCEAFATIAEHTEQWGPPHIFVEHAIGEEEFWTALRRALDHLKSAEIVYLNSSHLHLRAAKKEDLKAIWSVVDAWDVMATDSGLTKCCMENSKDGRAFRGLVAGAWLISLD